MQLDFENNRICPIQEKDAWPLCDFVVANADRLRDYFPETLKANLNPTLSKLFVTKKVKQFLNREELLFTIRKIDERQIIGLLYVKNILPEKKQAEIAYCIGYQFEGLGIITQATKLIPKWAFDNLRLKTLQLIIHKENNKSKNVALNNQFVWKKSLANEHQLYNGNWVAMELFELVHNEPI